jgi:hypothetical protein
LKPNTRYLATAKIKTSAAATAQIGVLQGAEDAPLAAAFTTIEDQTSATLICRAHGAGTAFFDDVKLEAAP